MLHLSTPPHSRFSRPVCSFSRPVHVQFDIFTLYHLSWICFQSVSSFLSSLRHEPVGLNHWVIVLPLSIFLYNVFITSLHIFSCPLFIASTPSFHVPHHIHLCLSSFLQPYNLPLSPPLSFISVHVTSCFLIPPSRSLAVSSTSHLSL